MTSGTCSSSDNGCGTTWKKKKTNDKEDGCCGRRPEDCRIGKEDCR